MGCMSVERFLCCFSLEAGGYICSIFTGVVAGFIWVATIVDLFVNMGQHDAGAWVAISVNIVYYGLLTLASWQLFVGTKNSIASKMRLFLIFMLLGVIVGFLSIFMVGWFMVFFALIWACILLYFYVCIRSLFYKVGGQSVIC